MGETAPKGAGVFERNSHTPRAVTSAKRLRKTPTAGERKLWQALRELEFNIRRQAPIGNYVVDFVCHRAKLVIEVDGYHHTTEEGRLRDLKRDAWLNAEGYRVLRFSDHEALEQTARAVDAIRAAIAPLPLEGGGVGGGGVPTAADERTRLAPNQSLSAKLARTPPSPALPPSRGKGEEIMALLAQVPDPEIPAVSVVDLGIVRGVSEAEPPVVTITPTYTGCPATVVIEGSIRAALDRAGFSRARIVTTLDPPWTTDAISDEGREKLRAYGIAPPPKGAASRSLKDEQAECPQCGSAQTEEISRFGSTPCKALWRCLACAEPFDRFKCH